MAEKKQETKTEMVREYVIPLRNEWRKVANYRRAGRAIKTIKKFIARHMKVPDRDVDKVKIDIYLNQEVWFKGKKKPPAKIKVRAIKEGDVVKVVLLEMPISVKFAKIKHERMHRQLPKEEKKPEEKGEVKVEKSEERKNKGLSKYE